MTQQYLRNVSLIIANPAGKGIQLGALRCVFEVRRGDKLTPNSCDVRVYNLSNTTANALQANKNGVPEFTQLTLSVSYGAQPVQRIFWGSITQVRLGREDQRNSYVDFTAADGDEPYNFSSTAFTLAAGATPLTGVKQIIADMAKASFGSPTKASTDGQSLSQGYVPPVVKNNTTRALRGRAFYGNCKDELRQFAEANDCWPSIQDGQVTLIPKTGYIPEPPLLITPSTGLIGVPEQTQTGLRLRVLMNPSIKIGRAIKLDSSDVNQLRYGLDKDSLKTNISLPLGATKVNADGLYYVMRAEHNGDSRGTPWYTEMTCLAVDATLVPQPLVAGVSILNVIRRY